jgi:hypothetical protein
MTLPFTYEVFPRSGRLEGVDRLTPTLSVVGFVNVVVGGTVEGPLRPPDGGAVFTL